MPTNNDNISETTAALAAFYRDFMTTAHTLGTLIVTHSDEAALQLRKLRDTGEQLQKIAQDQIQQIDERKWHAPSAYHAYFCASSLRAWLPHASAGGFVPLFRGQSKPYPLIPSIYRPQCDRLRSQTRMALYDEALNLVLGIHGIQHFGLNGHKSVAQHYGIPTDLLDFSVDPAVAIHFATSSSSSKAAPTLYCTSLQDILAIGGSMAIPPPFAERIFLQKGLFVRCDANGLEKRDIPIFQFTFPSSAPFPVYRLNSKINLLKSNAWLNMLADWTETNVDRVEGFSDNETFVGNDAYDEFSHALRDSLTHARWIDSISELIYDFAIGFKDGKEYIDLKLLKAMCRDNEGAIWAFLEVYAAIAKKEEQLGIASSKADVIAAIRAVLKVGRN